MQALGTFEITPFPRDTCEPVLDPGGLRFELELLREVSCRSPVDVGAIGVREYEERDQARNLECLKANRW